MATTDILAKLSQSLGLGGVLVEESDKAKYLKDWSGNGTGKASAVVRPTTTQQVAEVLTATYEHGIPVVPQSGNTGLAGGAVPDQSGKAILLSLERMNKIREISPSAMTMTAEAGCILSNLHETVEARGLFFPLNFGAKGSCMLGGNLSTNAGGSNVVRYGNTRELCLGIEAVLPDGRTMNLLSGLRKNNTGYDLKNLMIGAEGTLGVITAATMKLYPLPKARATAYVALRSLADALEFLNYMQSETGGAVEAFEIMPDVYMRLAKSYDSKLFTPFADLPPYSIMIEIAATSDAEAEVSNDGTIPVVELLQELSANAMERGLLTDAVFASSEAQRNEMWHLREMALEVISGSAARFGFDISLPLDRVHEFVAQTRTIVERYSPDALVNPLGHLGDGNLHLGIFCPPGADPASFKVKSASVKEEVLNLLAQSGGSFSAEHGIGTSKLTEMTRYKDPVAIAVMRQIKAALDPKGLMNPTKLIPAP